METSTPASKKERRTPKQGVGTITVSPISAVATGKSYPRRERKPRHLDEDYWYEGEKDTVKIIRDKNKLGSASKKRKRASVEHGNADEVVVDSSVLEHGSCNSVLHLKPSNESIVSAEQLDLDTKAVKSSEGGTTDVSEALVADSSSDSSFACENTEQYLELKREVERLRTTRRLAHEVKQDISRKYNSYHNGGCSLAHFSVEAVQNSIGADGSKMEGDNEKVVEMPKKRGRKSNCKDLGTSAVPSNDSNVTIDTSCDAESFLNNTAEEILVEGEGQVEKPVQKRKRGRKPKTQEPLEASRNDSESFLSNTVGEIQERIDELVPKRKRGRKPKTLEPLEASRNYSEFFLSNTVGEIQEKIDEPVPKRKRGRPKKVVDIEMSGSLSKDSAVERNPSIMETLADNSESTDWNERTTIGGASVSSTPDGGMKTVSKRGRKRKAVDYSSLASPDEDWEVDHRNKSVDEGECTQETPSRQRGKDKTPKSSHSVGQTFTCKHCAFESNTGQMRMHYAVQHHLAWSHENEAGSRESRADIRQILKYRKSLLCPKCDKQMNFDTYYWQHLQWCGREKETYICEHCLKGKLMLQWRHLHLKTCPGLARQAAAQSVAPPSLDEDSNHDDNNVTAGGRKKRKAYKKAITMVHNISKEMQTGDDSDGTDSNDPDVNLDSDFEEEDDDIADADDNISNEEEGEENEEDIEGLADIDVSTIYPGLRRIWFDWTFHMMFYEDTLKLQRTLHDNTMFPEWLPRKDSFMLLSDRETESYLPKTRTNWHICSETGPSSVNVLEGHVIEGYPTLFTGLDVWRMAWCPQPPDCTDEQVLAVVGKISRDQPLGARQHYTGPGVVQLWNTGVTSNFRTCTSRSSKVLFNLAHDYGHVTGLAWCPVGAYQQLFGWAGNQSECFRRMGLLALALTDGTVRIFSIPYLDDAGEGEVRTLKTEPTLTLLAHREPARRNLACTSLDWGPAMKPDRILAGYSDGTVRLFNLASESPLQQMTTGHVRQLLPCSTFQFHSSPVRAVRWCGTDESKMTSGGDRFDTIFRDLENPNFPQCDVASVFMATSMAPGYFYNGIFIASDDNYGLYTNRSRYLKMRSLTYQGQPLRRSDESYSYYLSSQHCPIWDISISSWLNFGITCDDLGRVMGMPLKDLLVAPQDTKTYKHRLQLVSTEKKLSDNKDKLKQEDLEHCKQCEKLLPERISKSNSNHTAVNQSDSVSVCTCDKTDQSKSISQKADNSKTDQSEHSPNKDNSKTDQSESISQKADISKTDQSESSQQRGDDSKTDQSENGLQKDNSKTDQSETISQKEDNSSNSVAEHVSPQLQEQCTEIKMSDGPNCLVFMDYNQIRKQAVSDWAPEMLPHRWKYETLSEVALKACQFNPNHQQCCWFAYGGVHGIVRLSNLTQILPLPSQKTLRENNLLQS